MIKPVEMYTVICDSCGKDCCEGQEYSCWNDEGAARDIAMDDGWIEDEDRTKHYCPKCHWYDDNDDLVIKKNP